MAIRFGKRLDAWCEQTGKTYEDLANAAGITVAAVYQWRGSGKSRTTTPKLGHLEAVVKAFGITMEQFWGPLPGRKRAA